MLFSTMKSPGKSLALSLARWARASPVGTDVALSQTFAQSFAPTGLAPSRNEIVQRLKCNSFNISWSKSTLTLPPP